MPICEIWIFSLLSLFHNLWNSTRQNFVSWILQRSFISNPINSLEPDFQSHDQFNLISIILLPTQNLETRVLSQFSQVLFQSAAVLLQVPSKAAADVTFPNIVVSIRPTSIAAKKSQIQFPWNDIHVALWLASCADKYHHKPWSGVSLERQSCKEEGPSAIWEKMQQREWQRVPSVFRMERLKKKGNCDCAFVHFDDRWWSDR